MSSTVPRQSGQAPLQGLRVVDLTILKEAGISADDIDALMKSGATIDGKLTAKAAASVP
ncbi:MAG: hypothetical protein ABSD08_04620 [Xanthobacteraceae bacterium]